MKHPRSVFSNVDLTTDLGLTFLCTYPGSVVLTALLDTANQVTETCELNNQISIQDLTLSSHLCQGQL